MNLAIGDALVALVDWAWPRVSHRVDGLLEHVAEAVRPHPPLSIRSLDGELLTGLIVADRGQAILFIGTRTRAAGPTPIPLGAPRYERRPERSDDDAMPLWGRDLEVDLYRHR